ncbi:hypothetical protein HGI30_17115 [Paenibacillus albicereus]|uniref:Uncharacterized protein n=1 Tax=Paenibacillus albicereus TaxID=2726185 RepID=A0A6H2H0A7_9BACL|nr:hypothetical protein [Paenibacillus albicereus]QJC53124.1 hypothetical protein HGI30_17115 [Paenibacillus albicereus]
MTRFLKWAWLPVLLTLIISACSAGEDAPAKEVAASASPASPASPASTVQTNKENWVFEQLKIPHEDVIYDEVISENDKNFGTIKIRYAKLLVTDLIKMDAAIARYLQDNYKNHDGIRVHVIDKKRNSKYGYFVGSTGAASFLDAEQATSYPSVSLVVDSFFIPNVSPDREGITIREFAEKLDEIQVEFGGVREKSAAEHQSLYGNGLQFFANIDGAELAEFENEEQARECKERLEKELGSGEYADLILQKGYLVVWIHDSEKEELYQDAFLSMTP